MNKTASLSGVVNDVAILFGDRQVLGLAFLSDKQTDPVTTSYEIANCSASIWAALGERVDWPSKSMDV